MLQLVMDTPVEGQSLTWGAFSQGYWGVCITIAHVHIPPFTHHHIQIPKHPRLAYVEPVSNFPRGAYILKIAKVSIANCN